MKHETRFQKFATTALALAIAVLVSPRSSFAGAAPAAATAAPVLAPVPQPRRIIALSPALTEIIYALNLQDKLVGVSDFSDFPAEAKQKASVGPYTKPNLEKIFSLHADLVLIPDEGPIDIKERLGEIKTPYKVISMRKLDEVAAAAIEISKALGQPKRGEDFARNWRTGLAKLFLARGETHPQVLIEIQNSPFIAAGGDTFLDEIVRGCGGTNLINQKGYPKLALENLTQLKPKVVIIADFFSSSSEKKVALENLKLWGLDGHASIKLFDPDFVTRPGPRLLHGAALICEALK